jgi:hypothetical protein
MKSSLFDKHAQLIEIQKKGPFNACKIHVNTHACWFFRVQPCVPSDYKQYPEIIAISFLISNLLISIYT